MGEYLDSIINGMFPSVFGGVIVEPANNSIKVQWNASVDSGNVVGYILEKEKTLQSGTSITFALTSSNYKCQLHHNQPGCCHGL